MAKADIRTVFVTCAFHEATNTRVPKVHIGRLGEFPPPDRFAAFPPFDDGYAFFEAEKLPKGAGWRFLRMIPLEEVNPALLRIHANEMKRVDHCRTRGPAPNPQATDW
jgi:hypothetical protein